MLLSDAAPVPVLPGRLADSLYHLGGRRFGLIGGTADIVSLVVADAQSAQRLHLLPGFNALGDDADVSASGILHHSGDQRTLVGAPYPRFG